MNNDLIRAIKRSELEEIRNKINKDKSVSDYLYSIIKNGTEIWITKDKYVGIHLGLNDYVIKDKEVSKELINILNKVNIESIVMNYLIDKDHIVTFENIFDKKEYIRYLADWELKDYYKKKEFYL